MTQLPSVAGGSSSFCCHDCCCADLHGAGQSPDNNLKTDSAHSLVGNGTSCCSSLKSGGQPHMDTPERRAERAESLVLMGEVSAGRQALEGAPLAPGTQLTLDQLRDPVRRPTVPYAPLPQPILQHQAERPFALDKELFLKNLKRARRGAAAGPSGSPQKT